MFGHTARKHSPTEGENEILGGRFSANKESPFVGFSISSGLDNPEGCLGYKKVGKALLNEIWKSGGIISHPFQSSVLNYVLTSTIHSPIDYQ